jgi:hypothetical protein
MDLGLEDKVAAWVFDEEFVSDCSGFSGGVGRGPFLGLDVERIHEILGLVLMEVEVAEGADGLVG